MKQVRITVAFLRGCAILGSALVLAACATRSSAPVEERRAVPPPIARVPAPAVPPLQSAPQPPTVPAAEPEIPPTYTVKRGDTLAGIALEHGLDYRELAAWNGIENPNRILVGQMLRLAPPGEPAAMAGVADPSTGVVTAPLRAAPPIVESRVPPPAPSSAPVAAAGPRNTESLKVAPKAVREPYSEERAREMARALEPPQVARVEPPRPATPSVAAPSPAPSAASPASASVTPSPVPSTAPSAPSPPAATASSAPASGPAPASALANDEDLDWIWPARGKLVTGFSDTANLKGIDIAGAIGQPIVASAAGRVVYAGSGLRGYGKLVIIKHNAKFLTAYAHNREIVVKEGQQVARGQKIAEMGNTDADQVKLHFEIRRLGKPMDPLRYLPPAS